MVKILNHGSLVARFLNIRRYKAIGNDLFTFSGQGLKKNKKKGKLKQSESYLITYIAFVVCTLS
jgi:hypothetical protein